MDLETTITNKDLKGKPEFGATAAFGFVGIAAVGVWFAGNAWGGRIRPAKPHEVPGGNTTDVYHVTHYDKKGRLSYNKYMDTGQVGEVHTTFNRRNAKGEQIKMNSVEPSRRPLYDREYSDPNAYENSPAYQHDNRRGK